MDPAARLPVSLPVRPPPPHGPRPPAFLHPLPGSPCIYATPRPAAGPLVLTRRGAKEHEPDYGVVSIHHVGILCENLERSMAFYKDLLGLKVNPARPTDKLPYRGAWLWVGSEMIHLMELPNPDPLTGRPEHGGRDRHTLSNKPFLSEPEVYNLRKQYAKSFLR